MRTHGNALSMADPSTRHQHETPVGCWRQHWVHWGSRGFFNYVPLSGRVDMSFVRCSEEHNYESRLNSLLFDESLVILLVMDRCLCFSSRLFTAWYSFGNYDYWWHDTDFKNRQRCLSTRLRSETRRRVDCLALDGRSEVICPRAITVGQYWVRCTLVDSISASLRVLSKSHFPPTSVIVNYLAYGSCRIFHHGPDLVLSCRQPRYNDNFDDEPPPLCSSPWCPVPFVVRRLWSRPCDFRFWLFWWELIGPGSLRSRVCLVEVNRLVESGLPWLVPLQFPYQCHFVCFSFSVCYIRAIIFWWSTALNWCPSYPSWVCPMCLWILKAQL